jgi:hypothetical protein
MTFPRTGKRKRFLKMAGVTGLEPAASAVTGHISPSNTVANLSKLCFAVCYGLRYIPYVSTISAYWYAFSLHHVIRSGLYQVLRLNALREADKQTTLLCNCSKKDGYKTSKVTGGDYSPTSYTPDSLLLPQYHFFKATSNDSSI